MNSNGPAGAEMVLERTPGPGWSARLTDAEGRVSSISLASERAQLPSVLDGLVAAAMPLILRSRARLRVAGPISRSALRNLTELGEAWAKWQPSHYHPPRIEPDQAVDGIGGSTDRGAWVAWSGSLRSTHILVRHLAGQIPGTFRIRGVVRVWGLHPQERPGQAELALEPARRVFGELGLPLHTVSVTGGFDIAGWGGQPWAAAALHLVGSGSGAGLMSRPWPWNAQLRYPRPGLVLPDLWSGDFMSVHWDAGGVSAPDMWRALSAYPELSRLVSNCHRQPRHLAPCGRCMGCRMLDLARAAAGDSTAAPGVFRIATLPLGDLVCAAEASHLVGPSSQLLPLQQRILTARIALNKKAHRYRSTLRWLGSASGLTRIWPR